MSNDRGLTPLLLFFFPEVSKINRAALLNKHSQSIWIWLLLADCLQDLMPHTLRRASNGRKQRQYESKSSAFLTQSFDCVCKLIPFVWININSARLLPFAYWVRPILPFSVANSSTKLALQLSSASYYHHYWHQHNSGCKATCASCFEALSFAI